MVTTVILAPLLDVVSGIAQIFTFSNSFPSTPLPKPTCKVSNLLGTVSLQASCVLLLLWTSSSLLQKSVARVGLATMCLLLWFAVEAWSLSILLRTDEWLQSSTSIYSFTSTLDQTSINSIPICLSPFNAFPSRIKTGDLPPFATRSAAKVLPGACILVYSCGALVAHVYGLKRQSRGGENQLEMEQAGAVSNGGFEDGNRRLEEDMEDHNGHFEVHKLSRSDSVSRPRTRAMRQEASDSTLVEVTRTKSLKKLHLSPASSRPKDKLKSSPSIGVGAGEFETIHLSNSSRRIECLSPSRQRSLQSPSTSESALILIFSLIGILVCLMISFCSRRGNWRGAGAAFVELGFSLIGTILRCVLEKSRKRDREREIQSKLQEIKGQVHLNNDARRRSSGASDHYKTLRLTSTFSSPQHQRKVDGEEEGDVTLVMEDSPTSRHRNDTSSSSESVEEVASKVANGNEYSSISNTQSSPEKKDDRNSFRSSLPSSTLGFNHNPSTFSLPFVSKFERSLSDSLSVASTSHRLTSRLVAEKTLSGIPSSSSRPILNSPLPSYLLSTERAEQTNQGFTSEVDSFTGSENADETLLRKLRVIQDSSIDPFSYNLSANPTPPIFDDPFRAGNSSTDFQDHASSKNETHNTCSSFGNLLKGDLTPREINTPPAMTNKSLISPRRPSLQRNPLSVEGEKVILKSTSLNSPRSSLTDQSPSRSSTSFLKMSVSRASSDRAIEFRPVLESGRNSPTQSIKSFRSNSPFSRTRKTISKIINSDTPAINVDSGDSNGTKSPRSAAFSLIKAKNLLSKPSSTPNLRQLSDLGTGSLSREERARRSSILDPLSRDPLAKLSFGAEIIVEQTSGYTGIQGHASPPSSQLELELMTSQMEIDSDPLDFYTTL